MAFQLLPLLLRFPWKWFPHKVHACYKNIFSTVCIFETDQNSLQFNHIISLYFQSPEAIKKCHCAIPQFQNQSATSRLSSFSPRPSFPYSLPSSSDFFFLLLLSFFILLFLLLSPTSSSSFFPSPTSSFFLSFSYFFLFFLFTSIFLYAAFPPHINLNLSDDSEILDRNLHEH